MKKVHVSPATPVVDCSPGTEEDGDSTEANPPPWRCCECPLISVRVARFWSRPSPKRPLFDCPSPPPPRYYDFDFISLRGTVCPEHQGEGFIEVVMHRTRICRWNNNRD